MKKVIIKLALALGILSTALPTLATIQQPTQCPSLEEIQSALLLGAVSIDHGIYAAASTLYTIDSQTNETYQWGFGIVGIRASSESSALRKAKKALKNLNALDSTPQYIAEQDGWGCRYLVSNKLDYLAAAITPIPN